MVLPDQDCSEENCVRGGLRPSNSAGHLERTRGDHRSQGGSRLSSEPALGFVIPRSRQAEVSCLAVAIDRPEQIHPFTSDPNEVSSMCQVDDFRFTSPHRRRWTSGPYV